MTSKKLAQELKNFRKNELKLTQQEMADKLKIKRSRYANFEIGVSNPSDSILKHLHSLGFQQEVGPPLVPASTIEIPLTYIGFVAASDPVNWTDPFESESFEYVPTEMGDVKGRFACRIASDSMMPLLEPDDLCVFQTSPVPKIGCIILFRSKDNLITVKQLKHDGNEYMLHPLNQKYKNQKADGETVGFLIGIVRSKGTLKTTIYDPSGIRP